MTAGLGSLLLFCPLYDVARRKDRGVVGELKGG
jgi:hypothetical protein